MRNIPVIAYILKSGHKVVLVTGERQIETAKTYFEKYTDADMKNIAFVSQNTDFGLAVKAGTLVPDVPKIKKELRKYINSFDERISSAVEVFKRYAVDCVVCDIVPWALKAAKSENIPSVLMASFTWIEIYEEFLEEDFIKPFRDCFDCVDKVLLYELANEPTRKRFQNGENVGFVAREFNTDKINCIKNELGEKPIVFVSVGGSNSGLKDEIDVSELPYNFVVTMGIKFKGENVRYLPPEVDNTQDYVAASDYCITKAGWTTVAEAMLAGKPMALLSRPDVAEDRMTIEMLTGKKRAVEVSVEELKDIAGVIEKIKGAELVVERYDNCCEGIAERILGI
jgi:hypothetical protein